MDVASCKMSDTESLGTRWWLANMPASKTLTSLEHIFTKSDAVLHHAVMQTGLLKYVRQVYVQISTGSADVDTFRQVSHCLCIL